MRSIALPMFTLAIAATVSNSCVQKQENPRSNTSTLNASTAGVVIFGDANRNGRIDDSDLLGHEQWNWKSGSLFLANVDDDDRNGVEDFKDDVINGTADLNDIAKIRIVLSDSIFAQAKSVSIEVEVPARDKLSLFEIGSNDPSLWRKIASSGELSQLSKEMTIGLEGKQFADAEWNGRIQLRAVVKDASGNILASDVMAARVAPWLMLPNSAKTTDLYIASGPYNSKGGLEMLKDLRQLAAETKSFRVHEYRTTLWQEMWMQDTVEIGYTEMPNARMHVAFRASRCEGTGSCDRFARTILGKDMGFIEVPMRGLSHQGQWDNWFGNVEVTHPVPAWPLGRIYYGSNLNAGWKSFLNAQEIQKPFELDPTWLLIKHVDEIFNFLPGTNGQPILIASSPSEWAKISSASLNDYNRQINAKLEAGIAKVKKELELDTLEVIRLPLTYSEGGINDWSSPINSVHLNGVIALGNTNGHDGEMQLSATPQGKVIQKKLEKAGFQVRWTNDIGYQPNHGNVHCGTNTRKLPLQDFFWQKLPNL